jgi:hypothetical protein
MDIIKSLQKYGDNLRIVWDNDDMQPERELVYVGGNPCLETRYIKNYRVIVQTNNFSEALEKLINP